MKGGMNIFCDAVTRGTQQSEIPFWDLRAWTMGGHRQDRILYFPATKVNYIIPV